MKHTDVDLQTASSNSQQKRADRLKLLRTMTGLSRKKFSKKYGISLGNFQNWEGPRYGGLTEKGANKIVLACLQEGIEVTIEWLMYGTGIPPVILRIPFNDDLKVGSKSFVYSTADNQTMEKQLLQSNYNIEQAKILQELDVFKKHYGYDVLAMVIADDAMEPFYRMGDHIAGKRHIDVTAFIGSECIIETANNRLLLRVLTASNLENRYTLLCNKKNAQLTPTASTGQDMQNVEILSVAPVMWIRRFGKE